MNPEIRLKRLEEGYKFPLRKDRDEELEKMLRERFSQADISRRFNFTRERARQLVNGFKQRRAINPISTEPEFYTVREAAKSLAIGLDAFISILDHEVNKKGKKFYILNVRPDSREVKLIPRENLERLKEIVDQRKIPICRVCEKKFDLKKRNKIPGSNVWGRVCSLSCSRKYTREKQLEPTNPKRQSALIKEIYSALQAAPQLEPQGEERITLFEAVRLTRLTISQIQYLKDRSILITLPHPSKTWRGRPTITYSKTQLQIVKEVVEKHVLRKS